MWLDDRPVLHEELLRGPFRVEAALSAESVARSPVLLHIDADPAFIPRPPEVGKPYRILGVSLRSICLSPE